MTSKSADKDNEWIIISIYITNYTYLYLTIKNSTFQLF